MKICRKLDGNLASELTHDCAEAEYKMRPQADWFFPLQLLNQSRFPEDDWTVREQHGGRGRGGVRWQVSRASRGCHWGEQRIFGIITHRLTERQTDSDRPWPANEEASSRTWHNLHIKLWQEIVQHTCPTCRERETRGEAQQTGSSRGQRSKVRQISQSDGVIDWGSCIETGRDESTEESGENSTIR